MIKETVRQDKLMGLVNPYEDRLGIIHIIDDGTRWSGKLIAIVGENLLFEKKTGVRVLVDPTACSRIIELQSRDYAGIAAPGR
jgi:hypothetical protein